MLNFLDFCILSRGWSRWLATALSVTLISFNHQVARGALADPAEASGSSSSPALSQLAALRLHFNLNCGQADPGVQFVAHGPGYSVFLTATEAVLSLEHPSEMTAESRDRAPSRSHSRKRQQHRDRSNYSQSPVCIRLLNAQPASKVEGLEPQSGTANYFIGNDPAHWHHSVPTFAKVQYRNVYPGIDLIYYGNQRQLEYDFVIQPCAEPQSVVLQFAGARSLELDDGSLVVRLAGTTVRWKQPVAYQEFDGHRVEVSAEYVLHGADTATFRVGDYDRRHPLIIDPVLAYSTYLGGGALDTGEAIAVDAKGNVYVTGRTVSLNFPTTNAFRSTPAGVSDAYVTKLNSNGTALIYSTYLGGSGVDIGWGIGIDTNGNAYVTGQTDSTNFPTRNAFQSARAGTITGTNDDAFISKLGPSGTNLLYSSYFGGADYDEAYALAVGTGGNAYITGVTSSGTNFPKKTPFQPLPGDGDEAFVARFSTTNSGTASLIYASWLGGADDDYGNAIVVDRSGNAFVTGEVYSLDGVTANFPVLAAFQPVYGGGDVDAFVTKISSNGTTKIFSSYLGGDLSDSAFGIALDSSTNIYVVGETYSTNFPIVNAFQSIQGGSTSGFGTRDVFVTKIHRTGSNLLYSTFLGGQLDESGNAIAVGSDNLVYVTGDTKSEEFPVAGRPLQSTYGGGFSDAFVAVLNLATSGAPSLIYSTYIGGSDGDIGSAITVDTNGNSYVTGQTTTTNNFPRSAGVFQSSFGGGYSDAFVAKFSQAPLLSISRTTNRSTLTWPTIPAGFNVQRNTNIVSTNWITVTNAPVVSNFLNRVTVTNNASSEFYRLRRP